MSGRLRDLIERRKWYGALGALEFLIAFEKMRGAPDRLITLKKIAQNKLTAAKLSGLTGQLKKDRHQSKANKPKELNRVEQLRIKLLSLGFTDEPLNELENILKTSSSKQERTRAAQTIGLWYLRTGTRESCTKALEYLALASEFASANVLKQLRLAKLLCFYRLGDKDSADKMIMSVMEAGEITDDLLLAYTGFQQNHIDRVKLINQVLAMYSVPAISLMCQSTDKKLSAYDRFEVTLPLPEVHKGPLVTVLVAAYNAPDTLPTCLRALQQQTWTNLEVLVIDDCSPTQDTFKIAQSFARQDSRFKAIRMPENRGAYVARNYGLSIAKGEFVTLHDADDWSHPLKIEKQARCLIDRSELIACTSRGARVSEDLVFSRLTGQGQLLQINMSSLMFRRKTVLKQLGYWDSVRFGADSEFISRIKMFFGNSAVYNIKDAVYSFFRTTDSSAVADEALGFYQMPVGVRLLYRYAQQYLYGLEQFDFKYSQLQGKSSLPVSRTMLVPKTALANKKHYDVVIASDFRLPGGTTFSNLEEINCHYMAGLSTGIVPLWRYDGPPERNLNPKVWDAVTANKAELVLYGDNVSCDVLIIRFPAVLSHKVRYIPNIKAEKILVIVNQSPWSAYGGVKTKKIYDISTCVQNVQAYFSRKAVWHPIGPLVRDALIEHHSKDLESIDLACSDWSNIIDIDSWSINNERKKGTGLRIGRHSRDDLLKWPDSKDELLTVYPERSDVEVHVLGGGESIKSIVGYLPSNWIVHEFGSISPKDFLAQIDVFVYFTSSSWVEAFGRTIIEAMAAGVPVVLPAIYEPLFKEAAIYASLDTAVDVARNLYEDVERYNAQVRIAQAYVRKHFSYETHLNRLKELGVETPE